MSYQDTIAELRQLTFLQHIFIALEELPDGRLFQGAPFVSVATPEWGRGFTLTGVCGLKNGRHIKKQMSFTSRLENTSIYLNDAPGADRVVGLMHVKPVANKDALASLREVARNPPRAGETYIGARRAFEDMMERLRDELSGDDDSDATLMRA